MRERKVGRKCYGIVFGWEVGGGNGRENGGLRSFPRVHHLGWFWNLLNLGRTYDEKRELDWKLTTYPLHLPLVFFFFFSNLTFRLSIYLFLLIYIDSIFFLLNFIYINLICYQWSVYCIKWFSLFVEFSYSYIYRGSIDFYYLVYNLKAWIQPKVL